MRIEITGKLGGSGATQTYTICKGRTEGPLNGIRRQRTRRVQVAERIRGSAPDVFYRLNTTYELSFAVLKQFDSYQDAETFCEEHEAFLPVGGSLTLTSEGQGGQRTTYSPAELVGVTFEQIGSSVTVAYNFIVAPL